MSRRSQRSRSLRSGRSSRGRGTARRTRRAPSGPESVYNLCEKPIIVIQKPPRHRSKHNPRIPPTATTFGLRNTTKIAGHNISGTHEDVDQHGVYRVKKSTGHMGRFVRSSVHPTRFRRKADQTLPQPGRYERSLIQPRKSAVPKRIERPIMGLRTRKNFVRSNIIENVSRSPPKAAPVRRYVEKDDYGQVPRYLSNVKDEIENEYELARQLQERHEELSGPQMELLPEEERLEILRKLQESQDELLKRYQGLSFTMSSTSKGSSVTLDNTNHLVRRKETLERDLDAIEQDILKFSKKNVFVYVD